MQCLWLCCSLWFTMGCTYLLTIHSIAAVISDMLLIMDVNMFLSPLFSQLNSLINLFFDTAFCLSIPSLLGVYLKTCAASLAGGKEIFALGWRCGTRYKIEPILRYSPTCTQNSLMMPKGGLVSQSKKQNRYDLAVYNLFSGVGVWEL